jgi:hypothetical protein
MYYAPSSSIINLSTIPLLLADMTFDKLLSSNSLTWIWNFGNRTGVSVWGRMIVEAS